MSRYSVESGNGSRCDVCNRAMQPFNALRITGLKLVPGKNYETCSSDVRYKRIALFHLCEKCYEKVITRIKEKDV